MWNSWTLIPQLSQNMHPLQIRRKTSELTLAVQRYVWCQGTNIVEKVIRALYLVNVIGVLNSWKKFLYVVSTSKHDEQNICPDVLQFLCRQLYGFWSCIFGVSTSGYQDNRFLWANLRCRQDFVCWIKGFIHPACSTLIGARIHCRVKVSKRTVTAEGYHNWIPVNVRKARVMKMNKEEKKY